MSFIDNELYLADVVGEIDFVPEQSSIHSIYHGPQHKQLLTTTTHPYFTPRYIEAPLDRATNLTFKGDGIEKYKTLTKNKDPINKMMLEKASFCWFSGLEIV